MPLSEDEQHRLDEIEQALRDDDPLFAATIGLDQLRRRRRMDRIVAFLGGLIALVVGEIAAQALLLVGVLVGLGGFLTMLVAAGWPQRHRVP